LRPYSTLLVRRLITEGAVMQLAHDPGKMRILIVDDCRDSADSLYLLTKLWGHDSMAVYDGSAALDLVETVRPDVMLVDIGMPGIDGNGISRAVTRRDEHPRPTLVALSGYADRAHRERARAAGFDHYLVKPIEPEILERFLENLSTAPALTA
jgi:CheY-like chemotaxis protein